MSIRSSVLKSLQSGRQYTAKQLAGMFKTTEASVRARVSELRSSGFTISTSETKSGKTKYSLA
jgi:biotin operon repressor